ncbi:MAG: hypothetical protein RSF40_04960 [Oscillospiraceae bacterium]
MDNKFFIVYVDGETPLTFKYSNKEEAESKAECLAVVIDKKVFVLEADSMIEPNEINIKVDSYDAALKYLGRDRGGMLGIADKHAKAMMAMYQLITTAEAWNKADEFVPDFDNTNQYKWFPWFSKQGTAGFVSEEMDYTTTSAYFGSRLCFKTKKRATQFGKQFIDLWNDFLLFR